MHEVHVFGDSHWRVFFPFVNNESPGVAYEQDGICMLDMVANELSGATMYGLLNDNSRNGARPRILETLDRLNGVENVALVFGEVDVRYHADRYFRPDGSLDESAVLELLLRYKRFIEDDLIQSDRVSGNVFVYYGFAYPRGERTLLQPGIEMGLERFHRAMMLHTAISYWLPIILGFTSKQIRPIILSPDHVIGMVSADGVHLDPSRSFHVVFSKIEMILDPLSHVPF